MKLLLAVILTLATTSVQAQTVEQMVAEKSDAEVVRLWGVYEKRCAADLSGEVTTDCLARTDLADVLRRRGICQNVIGNRWTRCLVQ